jgi:transposase
MLLPPDLRDWIPANHLAHFVVEAIQGMDLRGIRVNQRGTGSEQYPPGMMLSLLIYCYAAGVFSSRLIELATFEHVAVRFIAANTHPDHDTICTFRRENKALLEETFVRVLELAAELKLVKVGQMTVSVDGTKMAANASKHAAVSYERAGEQIAQLKLEVEQLVAKAEAADSTPLAEGLSLPEEIARRQARQAKLEEARRVIEQRAQERAQALKAEVEEKRAQRQARRENGETVRGAEPQEPSGQPQGKDQYNFTDPASRIMKAGGGKDHFEQAYNAQAAVEVDSRLIVGQRVSDAPNDKKELVATVAAVKTEVVGAVGTVLADSGYYSEAAVKAVEANGGPQVLAAVERKSHHRTVEDLEPRADPPPPGPEAGMMETMKWRLSTQAGQALYKLRQQTVEPVFGILKEAMGFRRFLLRGLEQVSLEWTLVCVAYNLKRLHRLAKG